MIQVQSEEVTVDTIERVSLRRQTVQSQMHFVLLWM